MKHLLEIDSAVLVVKLTADVHHRFGEPQAEDPTVRLQISVRDTAMVRPEPGYIWSRARTFTHAPPIYFAHADLSGMSLFEEAQYQGVRAAEAVMARRGQAHEALT